MPLLQTFSYAVHRKLKIYIAFLVSPKTSLRKPRQQLFGNFLFICLFVCLLAWWGGGHFCMKGQQILVSLSPLLGAWWNSPSFAPPLSLKAPPPPSPLIELSQSSLFPFVNSSKRDSESVVVIVSNMSEVQCHTYVHICMYSTCFIEVH